MSQQQQPKKQYNKPSRYITFAAGNVTLDPEGNIKVIRCNADPEKNSKRNDGQAFALYVVPIGPDGSPDTNGAIQVSNFAVSPTNADKAKYPNSPDFRAFFGVE